MQPRRQQKDLLSIWEHEWGKYSTKWHQLASVPRVLLVEMMRQWSTQSSANLSHTCYWDQNSNADIVLLSSQWDTGFTFVHLEFLFTFQTAPGRSASKCKKKRFTLMYREPCKEQAHIYLPCDPAFWNTPVASMRPEVFCFVRLACLSWTNSKSYSTKTRSLRKYNLSKARLASADFTV